MATIKIQYKPDSSSSPKTANITLNLTDGTLTNEALSSALKDENIEMNMITEITSMKGVKDIGDFAFSDAKNLTTINMKESQVSSIGTAAFSGCNILYTVEFSDQLNTIGIRAFSECTNLENIKLPETVGVIEQQAFSECSRLTTVQMPQKMQTIGQGAFLRCTTLESIEIPHGVTNIPKDTFAWCNNLSSIERIGETAFWKCESLAQVEIPETVRQIGAGAFRHCTKLSVEFKPKVCMVGSQAFEDPDMSPPSSVNMDQTIPSSPTDILYVGNERGFGIDTAHASYLVQKPEDGTTLAIPESLPSLGDDWKHMATNSPLFKEENIERFANAISQGIVQEIVDHHKAYEQNVMSAYGINQHKTNKHYKKQLREIKKKFAKELKAQQEPPERKKTKNKGSNQTANTTLTSKIALMPAKEANREKIDKWFKSAQQLISPPKEKKKWRARRSGPSP